MLNKYSWRTEFRLKVAALTLDAVWTGRVGKVVKPEYFELDSEQEAVAAIYEFRERFGRTPYDPEDVAELCTSEEAIDTVYDIFEASHGDMEMPKEVAIQWAKEQAVKIAVLDSIDLIDRGNLQEMLAKVEEATKVGDDIISPGIDFVTDIDSWIYDAWADKVHTGWPHVDAHLQGGLGGGELGVIFAPTNRGKSIALANIAYGAAGLLSGKNVLIFTHEMKASKYARRIAARMVFRFPNKTEDMTKYRDDVLELAYKRMPGSIKIVGGAQKMSVYDVQDSVNRYIDEGFYPDIIIDDYADLLIPPRTYKERRYELSSTYEWLRSFGGGLTNGGQKKDGVPIWTASQVGRQAYEKEIIRIQDVAEDIGKANTADVIIAICQTKDEASNNRCRLYMPKARDAEHGKMWDAKYYGKSQSIITIGETRNRDEDDV